MTVASTQAPLSAPSPAGPDAPRSMPSSAGTKRKRKRLISNIVLQVLAMLGILLLVYPEAADWFAKLGHNSEISGYIERVEATPSAERQRILDVAYAYNQQLTPGPLTDPYITQQEDSVLQRDVYLAYQEMLRISGTEAIGTLSYPRLDIGLPVYHGTTDETISKGVGHLYGTSLPVGGPSTRSVLTSHSGLPQAKLLTNLLKAQPGDTFWISVLGEEHHYRVEFTETVLPGESKSLQIIAGEDWVTLFTCAPIGINSHRFMVHAVRIPTPEDETESIIAGDGITAGFPWWVVWFVGGSGLVAAVLFVPPRKKRRGTARAGDAAKPAGSNASAEPAA